MSIVELARTFSCTKVKCARWSITQKGIQNQGITTNIDGKMHNFDICGTGVQLNHSQRHLQCLRKTSA
jgi:hypothetical protein